MKYDRDKVDEMTLALLYLVASRVPDGPGARAWKAFDMETIDRLHHKGWIEEPRSKSMTLHLTGEGYKKAEALFNAYFGVEED